VSISGHLSIIGHWRDRGCGDVRRDVHGRIRRPDVWIRVHALSGDRADLCGHVRPLAPPVSQLPPRVPAPAPRDPGAHVVVPLLAGIVRPARSRRLRHAGPHSPVTLVTCTNVVTIDMP